MKNSNQNFSRIVTGIIFTAFVIAFALFTYYISKKNDSAQNSLGQTVENNDDNSSNIAENSASSVTVQPTITNNETRDKPSAVLPTSYKISVPFTSQAPFANWDTLHEDACEEASLLMIVHLKSGTPIGDKQKIDDEITGLVNWESVNGYGPSITLEQLNEIAKIRYNLTGTVKDATVENIKTEIAAGRPVIVGAAGKVLPNPNFRNGGPNYHMLVIIGYNSTQFITNDPGTRLGQNFVYTYDGLFGAIHDWDANNIFNGSKKYLVFQ